MSDHSLHNLFFALWPDAGVRANLLRLQQGCPASDGRLHHPQDLHLTLVFLGRVLSEQLSCVRQVAAAIVAEPFRLELNQIDYWKRPRILWCGPDRTPEPLQCLVHDLQQGLAQCGFEPEKRTYKPHVTLARKARPTSVQRLDESVVWQPREFVLAGSHSGSKPPRYHILDRWEFRT